jgi:hypothetical protein
MFHFSAFGILGLCIHPEDDPVLIGSGFPIRKSTDQSVLAAPRGLSQLTASFFAFWHQGIHPKLLVA